MTTTTNMIELIPMILKMHSRNVSSIRLECGFAYMVVVVPFKFYINMLPFLLSYDKKQQQLLIFLLLIYIYLPQLDIQLLYNLLSYLFLYRINFGIRQGPVHTPIRNAITMRYFGQFRILSMMFHKCINQFHPFH